MQIYLGADHGGYELKEKVKGWLDEWGYKYEDSGNTAYDKDDDYPDYAVAVARKVGRTPGAFGVLACRSAAGMVIAANKVRGVRAGAAFDVESARHMREHNDANVLAVSGDWLDEKQVKDIIRAFLKAKFSAEERHVRRVGKIDELCCK